MTRTGLVHQALRYGSDDEFLAGTAEHARAGLDDGDTVLAVVSAHNISLLAGALGDRSGEVEFVDVRDWYDYPSRTLGRYHAYCDRLGPDRHARVIGEPVWTGRSDFETHEWLRYESLLNVVFAGTGHRILCPYDTRTLPDAVVRGAARTHPELAGESGTLYADPADFCAECDEHRPAALSAGPQDIRFARGRSAAVRRALTAYARGLGLPEQRTHDLVAAVHETVVNSVRHGGGQGVVRLHSDPDYVICEIRDDGSHASAPRPRLPGHLPPRPHAASGHGMWLVRQLSDLVADDLDPAGSVVRLYFRHRHPVSPLREG
ncbi:sensor histidine kinase [Streptomyces pseudovenezuelae]|uniref:Anti-sigma regulatory factor (Ser/Thr protein kinase) n=1 Tax=Streptomyces pseudovenezuelae TaxID=67350 RepID=A0ABT6LU37_9ACTN|nr:sensor histidine kinase [Streptomyces pseudovenezuelae]MDH6218969.1 anti-sigma regulatory factor (Ser/Thr protein kinase) [Streptomyces pseudovenezuelae]